MFICVALVALLCVLAVYAPDKGAELAGSARQRPILDIVRNIPDIPFNRFMEARHGRRAERRKHHHRQGTEHVPKSVRQALGVDYSGRIAVLVCVQNAEIEETADPVIDRFLELIAQDVAKYPEKSVLPFTQSLLDRAVALTAGMTVDPAAEIEGNVSIGYAGVQ